MNLILLRLRAKTVTLPSSDRRARWVNVGR
eukprot:SAG22_NODE_13301_length_411_cov_0.817308_1_plen_29_part_10